MRTIMKYAAAITLTGALAVAAATPSQARHWHNGAAIGAGIAAGALAGAAIASANNGYYGPDYYGPGYAYDPGYAGDYAYAPAPGYYGPRYYRNSDRNWRDCTVSPSSVGYAPCNNQ